MSSRSWLKRQERDQYVKKAKEAGYPSRAAFKLLDIQEKDRLIRPGMVVVDLGSAPGGWSMVARDCLKGHGRVIALDLLEMVSIPGVTFIQGDFTEDETLQQLLDALDGAPVDLVLSDMAPNLSGQRSIDQPRCIYLLELAYDFAKQVLKPGGHLLFKVFEGEGVDAFRYQAKQDFRSVKTRKPDSSRAASRESYMLATSLGTFGRLAVS